MFEIRRYRSSDYDAVWQLHIDALAHTGAHAGHGPWDDDLHQIEDIYLKNNGEFLVGTLGGQVIAMGALKKTSGLRAEIKRMRVLPSFQRRGFGQAILDRLEARARELGYGLLHLDTSILLVVAQRFYEKNGYIETHREKVGEFVCVFYEKDI
jgi:GNAT superfamily N-acetyltransferase